MACSTPKLISISTTGSFPREILRQKSLSCQDSETPTVIWTDQSKKGGWFQWRPTAPSLHFGSFLP